MRRLHLGILVAAFLPLCGAGGARAQTYAEQVIADGAIHYWRFEESSTASPAADEIPTGGGQVNNPGTYEGGITLSVPSAAPALGTAAEFDGLIGTHVALGTPQHPGDSFTIEAWVSPDSGLPTDVYTIAARWDGSWLLGFSTFAPGEGLLSIRNEIDTLALVSVAGTVPEAWHHVVGTFVGASDGGGGTATIYLDGVAGPPQTIGFDLKDSGGDDGLWYIGKSGDPASVPWAGRIDEVAIYPRALSATEIANHIALAFETRYVDEVVNDGAIHYWRFEETSTASPAGDEIPSGGGQTNNPGVYTGGITLGEPSAEAELGNAVRLDGGSNTHVALGAPQHPGPSISVEMWLRLDTDASSSGPFIDAAGRWDGSWSMNVDTRSPEHIEWGVRNELNGFAASNLGLFRREFWHHVVGVFDGASDGGGGLVTVYLDGMEGPSTAIGWDLQDAGGEDGSWYIGVTRAPPSSGDPWKGLIDEVAIYPYALSLQQVRTHVALSRVNLPEPSGTVGLLTGVALLALLQRRCNLLARKTIPPHC